MYDYETLAVLDPDLGEAEWKNLVQKTRGILEAGKAEVRKVDEWGIRELAHVIKGRHRGYYVLLEYGAEPAAVREMERQLKINDQVLRFLTVRQLQKKAPPPRGPREEPVEEQEAEVS